MRIREDRRGISNVVVFVLGLVIIVVIVSNVFLWNYEMNQLDWEKMHEDVEITDVARVTSSSWFVADSEYRVNMGNHVNGSYTDTQAVDDQCESFWEARWWNANYSYRRRITIENNVASTLDASYSVCVTMDTASLVSAGKMLSSGNDFRVAYWSGSGFTELDRHLVDMNTTSTRVWFKTQAAIGASPATDNNYYAYYGNPSATNPPANKSNVYVWFDDFSTNTLANYDKAKWVDIHGAPNEYVSPTYDAVNERVWFDTGDNYASDMYPVGVTETDFLMEVNFWANGSYPSDATVALVGRLENPGASSTHYYLGFSHGTYDSPGITVDSWVNGERSNTIYSEPSDYYWGFNTVHTFRYAIFGSTHKFWWNKDISQPADVTATDSLHTAAGRLGLAPAQVRGWWDNLKIRKYIEPEPSTSLGSEEMWNWWNTNYEYRRQITIMNNIASTLSSGYSIFMTLDTASLVSSGKMLSNGNDLRIVYWNGSSWVEIDRDIIGMNTGSTQVWFKTQADISASGSDNNYYMYYGNPSAGSPPANKSNVYDFWDDFNDASLDPAWTLSQIGGASGSVSESGTVVVLNATNSGDLWGTSDNFLFLSISRSYDVLVESYTSSWGGSHGTWSKMGGVQLRQSLDANSTNRIMSPVYTAAGATNSYRLSTGGSTFEQTTGTQPKYCRLSRIGGTSRAWYSTDGISWTELGSQISFSGGLSDPVRLGIHLAGLSSSSHWVEVDWFKVRKYVDPEPSTSLGSEEGQSNNRLDVEGTFVINVSTYPLTYIQTIEMQLRYRANDTSENWYLKAYNWTAAAYSDSGFNSTAGHTSTTGWDYYAVNLTDRWDRYVQNNGTIRVKIVDEGADTTQTTIDIDFLGVRAAINGTRFTFKNEGSLTSHLVSLWMINSTHHQRYDIDLIINSAQTLNYTRADISLPTGQYIAKVITERGNTATYTGS